MVLIRDKLSLGFEFYYTWYLELVCCPVRSCKVTIDRNVMFPYWFFVINNCPNANIFLLLPKIVKRFNCCFVRLGAQIGYGDPNLTAMVSENYEKMVKRRQITCAWTSTLGHWIRKEGGLCTLVVFEQYFMGWYFQCSFDQIPR